MTMIQSSTVFVAHYANGDQTHTAYGSALIAGILNISTMHAAQFGILSPLTGSVRVADISGAGHRV
jgi:hypothetical protein